MESLIIITGGIIGALSSFKKNFVSIWIWYINTMLALLPALGMTRMVSSMLDLPFIPGNMRPMISFLGLFLICLLLLFKICEQILPDPGVIDKFPVAGGKIAAMICNFLLGCTYAALAVYIIGTLPVFKGFIDRNAFKSTGAGTLYSIAYSATLQTPPDQKVFLKVLNALPSEVRKKKQGNKETPPAAQQQQQNKAQNAEQLREKQSESLRQTTAQKTSEKPLKKKKRKKRRKNHSGVTTESTAIRNTSMQTGSAAALYQEDPSVSAKVHSPQ